MLLPKTVVKPSSIEGVGLFADQDIKQGEIVWQYTPCTCTIFSEKQFQALLESFHKTERQIIQYYLTYSYYQKDLGGLIFCLDNGRFVNHSDQPNLGSPSHLAIGAPGHFSYALRPIKKGEELTEDYNSYDSSEWYEEVCKCYQHCHYESHRADVKKVANDQ